MSNPKPQKTFFVLLIILLLMSACAPAAPMQSGGDMGAPAALAASESYAPGFNTEEYHYIEGNKDINILVVSCSNLTSQHLIGINVCIGAKINEFGRMYISGIG